MAYPLNENNRIEEQADILLEIVRTLGHELKLNPNSLEALHLDSSFDRDLVLDSLARMEFFDRVERRFGISLPERVFTTVETPRELLREIGSAKVRIQASPARSKAKPAVDYTQAAPHTAKTLVEMLQWHTNAHPDRPHLKLINEGGDDELLSYSELQAGAEKVAAGLQDHGIQSQQAVAIMLPTSKDYFFTFFGVLIAGGIPVPIYPPARLNQLEDHLLRHGKILDNCQAVALVTVSEAIAVGRLLKSKVVSLKQIVTPDNLRRSDKNVFYPPLSADDIAFLQYTSGSTGQPKGVVLTHKNLLANIRAMGEANAVNSKDVFVSWLPLYHDMGLIGAWLGSLYYAAFLVIMSPLSFLAKPSRWLWAVNDNRATLTAAPNFAYELCQKRIPDEAIHGLRLDSLRAIFNGAEPVKPVTLERFCDRFAVYGLSPKAMKPVYGLAECSVGLAFPPVDRGAVIDQIQRESFSFTGFAAVSDDPAKAIRFVSCGRPVPGHEIRIVDNNSRELPERQQGRLQFRGPSATSGYFRNPEATQKLYDGDWLDSGDLAYEVNGEIYITSRVKDLIIHAGRNIYPHEIEEAVNGVAGVRKGCVAVFGSANPDSGTERLIVLAETRKTDSSEFEAIRVDISRIVTNLVGTRPDEVILAPPYTVLKTSSGKVRRSTCRELYEQGLIGKDPKPIWQQIATLVLSSGWSSLFRVLKGLKSYLFAGYAWLVILLIGLVTWFSCIVTPSMDWRWKIMRRAIRLFASVTKTPLAIRGVESLSKQSQPCVFVCNHSSYLDGLIIIWALPKKFSFIAKSELASQFMAGTFLRRIGTLFVDRIDKQRSTLDTDKITEVVNGGRSVMVFPEGTFTRMPGLLPFRMGAFVAAAEADVPVVPITLRGTRTILRSGSWYPRHGTISVTVGQAIYPTKRTQSQREISTWDIAVGLRDESRTQILTACGEPDLGYEKAPIIL
ncbi:MAG: AMP-binding protein [Methylococcales bacterium]